MPQIIDNKVKICKKCNSKVSSTEIKCPNCHSKSFHKEWVLDYKYVSKNTSIQITETNPDFGPARKRITLYKYWPGNHSSFNINCIEDWQNIRSIIDNDVLKTLGWLSKSQVLKNIESDSEDKRISENIKSLIHDYPSFSFEILRDFTKLSKTKNFDEVISFISEIGKLAVESDKMFFSQIKDIVIKLKSEKKETVTNLSDLLKEWNLKQITDSTREVKRRLMEISLFEDSIMNEKTYEIRGENSIHRILERSLWPRVLG